MSEISEITIGSLARGIRGVSYKPTQLQIDNSDGGYYLLRATNIQKGQVDLSDRQIVDKSCVKESQHLEDGDIIVCMSNGSKQLVGKSALVNSLDGDYCVGAFCSSFKVKQGVNPNFVFQIFQSGYFKRGIDVILSGSAINNLRNNQIEALAFKLPSSKPEQNKIAEILSTADEAIAHTEALIAKYQRIKTGLMQDLLTKGIDEDGNIRSKNSSKFVQTGLRKIEIPDAWLNTTFKSITKCKQGLQIPIASRFKEGGKGRLLYITVQSINNRFKNAEFIQNAHEGVICGIDDVLFTRTGNTGEIITGVEGVFHNNFFRVDFNRDLIEKDYLITFLKWHPIQSLIRDLAGLTTIPDLNHKDFFTIPIFCPKDKNEQFRIIQKMNSIDEYSKNQQQQLNKLYSLKTGLMQDLLSGRVRVNAN